jgi:DNA-binding transcriptional LysR family regulator
MTTNLDPVDLNLLVNIKRTQSITGAARAINISLSAASTRIKKLEVALNVQILYRESHGVRFTPAGLLILGHADLVLGSRQRLAEDLRQVSRSRPHVLRIRATSMLISETLPGVLGVYRDIHPNVFVEIQELTSEAVVGAVRRGDADIGIAWTDGDLEGLIATPYCQEKLVLITHDEHPLASHDEVWFSEALDYSLIGLGDFSTPPHPLSGGARSCKRVGSFEAICSMVAGRIGVGVVPQSAAKRYSRTLALRTIDLKDSWAIRNYRTLQRRYELAPYAQKFLEILMSKRCPDTSSRSPPIMSPAPRRVATNQHSSARC